MRTLIAPTRLAAVALCLAAALPAWAAERGNSPADLQFDYAEGLYRDGIHKLAIPELGKFLKLYPKHPRATAAHFELGDCLFIAKDYKTALPHFEAAAKDLAFAARPVALYRVGDCRYRLGDTKGAITPLRLFLAIKLVAPEHRRFIVHARYTLARAEFAQRNFTEALHYFEQVLVDPSPENAYRGYVLLPIGDCLVSLDKPDAALAKYRELEAYLVGAIKAAAQGADLKAQQALLVRVRAKVASLLLLQRKHQEALAVFGLLDTSGEFAEEVLYGRAQALFFLKRYQEALVPTLEYIKRFPNGGFVLSALFFAAKSFYAANQFTEAEQRFAELLSRDKARKFPAREAAAFGQAAAAYRQGQARATQTLAATDAYLKEFPKGPNATDTRFFHAEAAFWLGKHEPALASYRAIPIDNPNAEQATHQVAVCLDLLKRAEDAAKAYDVYLQRYPQGVHHQKALEQAARLWGSLKRYDNAAVHYGQFVDRYAKAAPALAQEFLYRKGACEFEAGQYDAMYATFKRYFDAFKDGPHKGDVHYFLAWYYAERKKQYEAAIPLYELCANMPGKYQKRALHLLAYAYARVGKARLAAKQQKEADELFGKAAATFLQLIRNAPDQLASANEYLWAGANFRQLGRNAEAIETYEALIKRYPNEASATVTHSLGDLCLNLEKPDYPKAEAYFRDFLKRFPTHKYVIWAKLGLAETLKGAHQHPKAWEFYQQVEQLAPHVIDNAPVRDGLVLKCRLQMGRMAFEDKNWEFARKYLLPVGMLGAGDEGAEALYKAGLATRRLQDAEAAPAIWQRLVRNHPDSPWTKLLIGELGEHGLRLAADGKTIEKKPPQP